MCPPHYGISAHSHITAVAVKELVVFVVVVGSIIVLITMKSDVMELFTGMYDMWH